MITSSVRSFNARFRKSLDQVIDHRANASGNEAATWHYRADRYGFAFMLRKQSNQPASAKVGRDVHAGFVGDAFSAHSPLANDERVCDRTGVTTMVSVEPAGETKLHWTLG